MNLTIQAYNSYRQNNQNISFQSIHNNVPRMVKNSTKAKINNYKEQMTSQGMPINPEVIEHYRNLGKEIW